MKRPLFVAALLAGALVPKSPAQIAKAEQIETAEIEHNAGWKWINFALLGLGLGYLIVKKAPAFFNARTEEIQKAIQDATGLKLEADFRSSEIDRKMATLGQEVQKLRAAAKSEMERESARIDSETRATLHRIHEHTLQEIDSLHHQAARSVREHAIRLATDLAVTELREHPEQIQHSALIRSFAHDVLEERGAA